MWNNDLINWSSTFSVGIKVIDDQHKGLLNLVNDLTLHVVGKEAEERAYFQEVIQQAVQYIKVHFATEEEIMTQAKYEGYQEHKKLHDSFVLTVIGYVRDFNDEKRMNLAMFTRFIKDWLLTHIAITDKQAFTEIKKIVSNK